MRGTSAGGSKGVRRGVQSWSARLREVREDWARCRRSVAKRRRRVAGRVARVAACGVGRALRSSAEGVSAATEKARGRSSRRQILTRLGGPMSGSSVRGSECVRSGARRAARSRAGPRGRVVRVVAQEGLRGGLVPLEAAPRGARLGILSPQAARCAGPLRGASRAPKSVRGSSPGRARRREGVLALAALVLALRVRARAGKSQALPGRCGPGTGNAALRAVSCNHDGGGTGCEARMS